MTLPRFFINKQVIGEERNEVFALRLTAEDFKHARVLRLSPGEHIAVIDASQDYFECEIITFDFDLIRVRIAAKNEQVPTRPMMVLVQGIAKGEKMDMVLRHATEIGVGAFIPFKSERSIVKLDAKKAAAKTKRWRAIVKSAAMQSAQPFIPEVGDPMNLEELCSFISQAHAVLICWEEEREARFREVLRSSLAAQQAVLPEDARIVIVVGPEGGLSDGEVKSLLSANRFASTVSLGTSILRTETAGVVAPALALYELGGLG